MQQHIKSPQIIPYPIPSQFWLHRFSPTTFQKLLISKHLTYLSQMLEAFRFSNSAGPLIITQNPTT